jgi:hypothetical protein
MSFRESRDLLCFVLEKYQRIIVYKQSNIVDIRLLIRLNHYYFFMPMLKPTANNEFFFMDNKKKYIFDLLQCFGKGYRHDNEG